MALLPDSFIDWQKATISRPNTELERREETEESLGLPELEDEECEAPR